MGCSISGLESGTEAAPVREVQASTDKKRSAATRACRVLVVDDNPGDARLSEVALHTAAAGVPYQITVAVNLAEALALVGSRVFDAALLDMGLPDCRGIETVKRFIAAAPQLPVVVLTGVDDDDTGLAALSVGAQDYLVKGNLVGPQLHRSLSHAIERKLIEARLRAAESEQRAMLSNSPTGVAVIATNGTLVFANARMESFLATSNEGLLGRSAGDLFRDTERYECMSAAVARGEQPANQDAELCRDDGEYVWAEVSLRPIRWHDQAAVLMWAYDISRRKHDEKTLLAAKDQAEALLQVKSDLLAMLSHEIRTPLVGIMGMVRLLLDSPLDATQQDWGETIAYSGEALVAILDDIFDLSKLENGKLQLDRHAFDLRRTVDGVVRVMSSRAEEKGLHVSIRISKALPRLFEGDARRLRQILLNLVGNAIKFTQSGDVLISVDDAGWSPTGEALLRFTVTDTGPGVAADVLARLFDHEASVLSHQESRIYSGSGLGLSICQRLVELMGGSIGADSVLGRGSAFWFLVPLQVSQGAGRQVVALPEPVRPAQATETLRQVAGTSVPSAISVLLVEDNLINQKVICGFLNKKGYRITVAQDGREGVEQASRQRFDIILMDIQMPRMDGLQATAEIRSQGGPSATTPIIALTANVMLEDQQTCLAAGMNAFLSKPLAPQLLYQTIEQALLVPSSVPRQQTKDDDVDLRSLSLLALSKRLRFAPARLKRLQHDLGMTSLAEVVGDFIAQSQQSLSLLKALASPQGRGAPSLPETMRAMHQIKVMAQNLGFMGLSSCASEIETAIFEKAIGTFAPSEQRLAQVLLETGILVERLFFPVRQS